ncbi:MAG TPA: hypothetical protein DDW50_19575 [Firmicutes bacterium]|jgi:hypothetical protein|nr:hypothetical protein [Bacillota bacterium]
MPNEEIFAKLESLCYLILMMDSLGLEITSGKVSEMWTKSFHQKELPAEFVEVLVFFWKKSRKQRNFSTLELTPMAGEVMEQSLEFPKISEFNQTKAPESKPVQNGQAKPPVVEKSAVKEVSTAPREKVDPGNSTNSSGNSPEPVSTPITTDVLPEDAGQPGRYVYGIALGASDFRTAGIDGLPVYTISYSDIGAIVHMCPPNAYESTEREQVEKWLRQHQDVLDNAFKYTSSVVPMTFDMIIDGSSAANPDDVLKQWLQERYEALKNLLAQLSGKEEYGIKISCSLEMITEKVSKENPEIIELTNRIAAMNKGTAYLFRSELAQKIRKAVDEDSKALAKEICVKIRPLVADLKENKVDTEIVDNQKPILNMAVLTAPDQVEIIGNFLEKLQTDGQYEITFTGPWPAYSFVKDLE